MIESPRLSRRQVLGGIFLSTIAVAALQACSSSSSPPATTAPAAAPTPAAGAAATSAPAAAPTSAPAAPTAAPTTAAAATPTSAPAPAAATSSGAVKATLTFADWWGKQFPQYIPTMQQKTGLAISEEQVPWPQFEQKLLTQFVAGSAPDFFLVDTYWNGDMFPSGNLFPLDDYLKSRSDVDPKKWNVDQAKENGYQGKTMGLSVFTAQDLIVHINLELADAQGLTKNLPTWGASNYDQWHWEDFLTWLKAGTKADSSGNVSQYGLGTDISGYNEVLKIWTYQNGGTEFDDGIWSYSEKSLQYDQPPAQQALQWLADMVLTAKVAPKPAAESAVNGGTYRAKRAVASINWSTPSIYPEEGLFKQTWISMPYSKNKLHRFGANYLSVNTNSKQRDAALEWATTFCVDKDVRTAFLQYSSVPAYDPLPIVNAAPDGSPKTIALINLSHINGMTPSGISAEGVVSYPGWDGRDPQFTDNTITAAMQSVMTGSATVKDAFAQAKQKIDADLATKK
jgi:ABC-type glycerol-3-phosphate transport system substrate-binding protein